MVFLIWKGDSMQPQTQFLLLIGFCQLGDGGTTHQNVSLLSSLHLSQAPNRLATATALVWAPCWRLKGLLILKKYWVSQSIAEQIVAGMIQFQIHLELINFLCVVLLLSSRL